jgi:hypothetical protein
MAAVEVIQIKGDATQAINALKSVGKEAKNTQKQAEQSSQAINDGMNALDKRTGGAVSAFKGLTGGIKSAVAGFKTLKGAIIATGLGALLVAITSLIAYFKETERGADQLRIITSALGAVMGKLMDVVIKLGEALFKAFNDPKQAVIDFGNAIQENIANRVQGMLELLPALGKAINLAFSGEFKNAGKVAADAVGKVTLGVENVTDKIGAAVDSVKAFGQSIVDAGKEGARIAKIFNEVEKAERELVTQRAAANKQIQEARFIADDLTKSTEERIAAIELAGKLEEQVANKELQTQRKKALALKQQAAISESNKETLNEIAAAEARVSELETASIARRKRLGMEITSLRKQQETATAAAIKKEQELLDLVDQANKDFLLQQGALLDQAFEMLKSDQQREIEAVQEKFFKLLELEELSGAERAALTEKQEAEIAAINGKYAQARIDQEKAVQSAKSAEINATIDMVQGALGSLFEDSKAVATANVLVDSAQAAVGIFKSSTSLPEPIASINRGVQLAALAATTFASIRKINQAQPDGGGSATPVQVTTPTVPSQAPQFNIVGQGGINQLAESIGGQFQQPIRAYVVGQDVTTSQQLQRQRIRTATFG